VPPVQPDFLTPYLQVIFETIGIPSDEFVRLEGMARGPEAVAQALDAAQSWINPSAAGAGGKGVALDCDGRLPCSPSRAT
jgi:hypothetical protein